MTGVITAYQMQQFANRGRPPFEFPPGTKQKVHAIHATATDGICLQCRSVFQHLLDVTHAGKEPENYTHYKNILELAESAVLKTPRCKLCAIFVKTIVEDCPDPIPREVQNQSTHISFTTENTDRLVSPVEKAIVRFTYTGPNDGLERRYFQVEMGEEWSTSLPGRRLAGQAPVGLVREWMGMCRRSHNGCGRVGDEEMPTRVIDVGEGDDGKVRLVISGEDGVPMAGKYAALSHCWGSPPPGVVTNLEDLDNHRKDIEYEKFPQNFKDAVLVTRKLGYRYLWIDSLCIIQNDALDWQRECYRMEAVYSNAAITIAAIGAPNSHAGFLGPRPDPQSCSITLQYPADKGTVTMNVSRLSNGQPCVFNQQKAILDSRAWAMQERLLSPRILSFGTEQMYYECCTSQFFESCRYPLEPRLIERRRWLTSSRFVEEVKAGKEEAPVAQDFYSAVGAYTFRYLTKSSDKLPAVGGIARRYSILRGDVYVAGVWKGDVLRGLIWVAGWHSSSTVETITHPRYDSTKEEEALGNPPTWSWASCDLPVTFTISWYVDHPLVEVLRCEAKLSGTDVFGQVSEGVLEALGWIVEGCVADEGDQYKAHWWGEDLKGSVCGKKGVLFARLFRDRPHGAEETGVEMKKREDETSAKAGASGSSSIEVEESVEEEQDTSPVTGPPPTNFQLLERESAMQNMQEMGYSLDQIEPAMAAASQDHTLAIEYLLNGLPSKTPPALPPRRKHLQSITVLILGKSIPKERNEGADWCGLALVPVVGEEATYRRLGLVTASGSHGTYGKVTVEPEKSLSWIIKGEKAGMRRVRIV